jgi:Xaa-Pro aminopeptidase
MREMPDVLIVGDTMRSPELRHEVPIGIGDPFVYAEKDGRRFVMVNQLEASRVAGVGDYEIVGPVELGQDDLIAQGLPLEQIGIELALRACQRFGITKAVVPRFFPLGYADFLREHGIELTPDREFFDDRRRAKNEAEIAGIRRAQKGAEAGMAAARDLLRRAAPNGAGLELDGQPLTCERVKLAIAEAFVANGCAYDEFIVAHGAQGATGHDTGSGQIQADEPVVIDLWPRDPESGCFADMTRTFVVGTPTDEVVEWQKLCLEALERAVASTKPGVTGMELFTETCELFQEHGYPTPLTKTPGTVLDHGFFHGLGHGVGLDVHEQPHLGLTGTAELVPGDVVTVEPGLYRPGYGGCRLEDLLLVTDEGVENLTDFPYDLAP